MAGKILTGLAVAAGTGLAIGFGSKRRTQANLMSDSLDNIPAIDPLLDRLDRIEARMSAVEARPGVNIEPILESLLGPHIADLRARLHAEMRESMEASLTTFEQTIDNKVSLRISMLEKALIDQSAIVTALSQRAVEAEENFQRLISAVERLCERKEQPVLDLPFERQPVPSTLPLDSGFRPRIVKEDDPKLRHRKRLTGL